MSRKIQTKVGKVLMVILILNFLALLVPLIGRDWLGSPEPVGSRTAPINFKGGVVRYFHPVIASHLTYAFVVGFVGIGAIFVVEFVHGRSKRNTV